MRYNQERAAHALQKILVKTDWDETSQVYQSFHSLMVSLMNQADKIIELCMDKAKKYYEEEEKNIKQEQMFPNQNRNQNSIITGTTYKGSRRSKENQLKRIETEDNDLIALNTMCISIIFLLDAYDSVVEEYARTGVAYFCANLIVTACKKEFRSLYSKKIQDICLLNGLDMFRMLTTVRRSQETKNTCTMAGYLLNDSDLNKIGFWDVFTGNGDMVQQYGSHFFLHPNVNIRKLYYDILVNIVCEGDRPDVNKFYRLMQFYFITNHENTKKEVRVSGVMISRQEVRRQEELQLKESTEKFDLVDMVRESLSGFKEENDKVTHKVLMVLKVLIMWGKIVVDERPGQGQEMDVFKIGKNEEGYKNNFNPIIYRILNDEMINILEEMRLKVQNQNIEDILKQIFIEIDYEKRSCT